MRLHYMSTEEKERGVVAEMRKALYEAREAQDQELVTRLVKKLEEEKRRIDLKYASPGTMWCERQTFDHPGGRTEVLPAGRYVVSEWRDLALRAAARHDEAMKPRK